MIGRAALAVLVAFAVAGCFGLRHTAPGYQPAAEVPYEAVAPLVLARAHLEAGELGPARAILADLSGRFPGAMAIGVMAQEAELGGASDERRAEITLAAAERARERPDVTSLLLAARLEPDPDRARESIERALEIDPDSAWAHYALAHLEARSGNWAQAQKSLARALDLEPGHLRARRLEAALLERDGKREQAIAAYRGWLAASDSHPLVDGSARTLARLDLAQLYLLEGREGDALDVLEGLAGEESQAARRFAILAAVEQALGRPERAIEAAREAQLRDPEDPLPLVQQALLEEHWLENPERAREAWRRVLEVARERSDLSALILSLRARVALERSQESGEASPGDAEPPAPRS